MVESECFAGKGILICSSLFAEKIITYITNKFLSTQKDYKQIEADTVQGTYRGGLLHFAEQNVTLTFLVHSVVY